MGKKKRKGIFDSAEERAAFMAQWDANQTRLLQRIEMIQAELGAKRQKQQPA